MYTNGFLGMCRRNRSGHSRWTQHWVIHSHFQWSSNWNGARSLEGWQHCAYSNVAYDRAKWLQWHRSRYWVWNLAERDNFVANRHSRTWSWIRCDWIWWGKCHSSCATCLSSGSYQWQRNDERCYTLQHWSIVHHAVYKFKILFRLSAIKENLW